MKGENKTLSSRKIGLLVIFIQFFIVILQSVIWFIGENYLGWSMKVSASAGISAFCGGIIYLIPFSVYTAFAVGRNNAKNFAGLVLVDFIIGFVLKFILLIALFVIVFKFIPTVHYIVFITFAIQFVTQWITFILLNSRY